MNIKRGMIMGASLLLFSWLQYQLWFDGTGILSNMRLAGKIDQQQEDNAVLAARNDILADDVRQFRGSMDSVEAKARKDLGMIKDGETFFITVEQPQHE